ncbi:MAG TPA: hypothetical protein VNI77_00535 [Nitrososphaera sp.]|nr:hypothetical protein [Nitrososphaera sp.]
MEKGITTTPNQQQLFDEKQQQQAIKDVKTHESSNAREIENEAIAVEDAARLLEAKIDPMAIEERAESMREIHQEISPPADAQVEENERERERQEEVRVIEHTSYRHSAIPDWPYAMMRQYVELTSAGMRLYGDLLKSSTDTVRLWITAWWSPWLQQNNRN